MKLSRRLLAAGAFLSIMSAALPHQAAEAAAKSGAKCPTVGATEGGLVCKKVGSSNRWVKAAAAPSTAPPTTAAAAATPATTAAPAADTNTKSVIPTTGDAPGVTDASVKIGFIGVVARGGSSVASTVAGDEQKQVQAIVDWANANGGVAGRKIVPVYKEMNVSGNTFQQAPVICASLTEDEKVFAVVLLGHPILSDRECYAKKKTLILDGANFPFLQKVFNDLSPYFLNIANPSLDRSTPAMVREAKARGYFDNAKVGIFTFNTPESKAYIDTSIVPELAKIGVTPTDIAYSGNDSPLTFFRDAATAVGKFQAKGIDHVIMLGSGGLGPVFALAAEAQQFFPRYLLNSNETPRFLADIPKGPGTQPLQPGTLKGAISIGFTPYQDTEDIQHPFPEPNSPEATCVAAYRDKGVFFTSRNNARYALSYCDAVFFLQAAGKGLEKNFTVQSVVASAENLGSNLKSASAYKVNFSKAQHDAGAGYRVYKFDPGCTRIGDNRFTTTGCWVADGPIKDL